MDHLMRNIPIPVEEIYNLFIKDREALKMDVPTDMMKIEVPISTIFSRSHHETYLLLLPKKKKRKGENG